VNLGHAEAVERVGVSSWGDHAAFERLFREQYRLLVHLAALVGARDPEGAAQESFVRYGRRPPDDRDPRAAGAYLRTIVVNLVRDEQRHGLVVRRRQHLVSTRDDPVGSDPIGDPELRTALEQLPPRQRQVVVLKYWLDWADKEIAAAMRISVGSVKSQASRGIATLRTRLEAERSEHR
jgi:RNA polymerase sigma factor (sigma-70 family)